MVLSLIGVYQPKRSKSKEPLFGPYKFIDDKFNLNYFQPLISNIPLQQNLKPDPNDITYYGQLDSKGAKSGFGIAISYEGHHFSGFFEDDFPNGEGRLVLNNGDVLVGNFKRNFVIGEAEIFYLSSQMVYKGQFDKNMPHGEGELSSISGKSYYVG
jgi:hypothetical protein